MNLRHLLVAFLAVGCHHVAAQTPDLPGSLSGRWTWTERGLGQSFSLDAIKARPDQSFTADLTWWTIDRKCAIRSAPIVGRQTATGLTFDATATCDVAFSAELARAPSGWVGKATTTSGKPVVVELNAD